MMGWGHHSTCVLPRALWIAASRCIFEVYMFVGRVRQHSDANGRGHLWPMRSFTTMSLHMLSPLAESILGTYFGVALGRLHFQIGGLPVPLIFHVLIAYIWWTNANCCGTWSLARPTFHWSMVMVGGAVFGLNVCACCCCCCCCLCKQDAQPWSAMQAHCFKHGRHQLQGRHYTEHRN